MSKNKLISNCVALKAAKNLDLSTWSFYGSLEIPFCESRKVHLSEFNRYINNLSNVLNNIEYDFYWMINIIDGNEWINDQGYFVKANTQTHFLLSDPTNLDGNPNRKYRDQIYHLLQATWRYEVNDVQYFNPESDKLETALGLNECRETCGLDNQIELSDSLFRTLFSEKANNSGVLR